LEEEKKEEIGDQFCELCSYPMGKNFEPPEKFCGHKFCENCTQQEVGQVFEAIEIMIGDYSVYDPGIIQDTTMTQIMEALQENKPRLCLACNNGQQQPAGLD